MDVFTCIRTRRAIRNFAGEAVPLRVIEKILEAGRLSPSSRNTQPWHFITVRSREALRQLSATSPTGKHIADAAFAVAVVMDRAKMPEVDGARAMQNMMLTAWEEGVGSCWVTNFDEERVKALLKIPKDTRMLTVVPFGYPAESHTTRRKQRKPLQDVVHWEVFGRKES